MAGSRELTELGRLLEDARVNNLGISAREAARRAKISESRWRQVVTGIQTTGGTRVPVSPTARTTIAMALAVNVEPKDALRAANLAVRDGVIKAHVEEFRQPSPPQPVSQTVSPGEPFDLQVEIDRVLGMGHLSAVTKKKLIDNLIAAYEEQQAAEPRREAG